MDIALFRAQYPEFADPVAYPDVVINRHLAIAVKRLPESRWADLLDDGIGLYIAHYLALGDRAKAAVTNGTAGQVEGLETQKTVDTVSVSMDVSAVTIADAGMWNSTSYGIQFYQLMMIVGAGGVQL